MPLFQLHLRRRSVVEFNDEGIEYPDLHRAYLQVFRAIPDVARDLLVAGEDPMECTYVICDDKGRHLLEVPFTEVLSPAEWRLRRARHRPHGGHRSPSARDDLALSSFRRMFGSADVACVLLTPELLVTEITDFGARHNHVDADAVRHTSILDIFTDLRGVPKENFTKFMMLARAGQTSEVIDLPYYVLDEHGESASGWWNARTWPIFDDDEHLLGLVEWAMPFTAPTAGGTTLVRVAPKSMR